MTQAIYRLKTDERWFEGKQIIKTPFKGIPCDMLAVEPEEVTALCIGDWFADPNKLIAKLDEAKADPREAAVKGVAAYAARKSKEADEEIAEKILEHNKEQPKKRGRPKKAGVAKGESLNAEQEGLQKLLKEQVLR